jgi:hypothetical protein
MTFDRTAAVELAWEMVMGNQEDDPNGQQGSDDVCDRGGGGRGSESAPLNHNAQKSAESIQSQNWVFEKSAIISAPLG